MGRYIHVAEQTQNDEMEGVGTLAFGRLVITPDGGTVVGGCPSVAVGRAFLQRHGLEPQTFLRGRVSAH